MTPYEQSTGHRPDFIVSYRLYSPDKGGRKVTYQHLRCDFMYSGDDPLKDGIFMIWPEFLGDDSQPLDDESPVSLEGHASMWIVMPEMRASHRLRTKIGTQGHFMEGSRRIGDAKIEVIVGLHENPLS